MVTRKNSFNKTPLSQQDMDSVAARYLNLWQENIKRWATDPDALEKWVRETARHIKSSDGTSS